MEAAPCDQNQADDFFCRDQSVDTTYQEREDGYDVGSHMLNDEGDARDQNPACMSFTSIFVYNNNFKTHDN
jgi:hypothetical protein